MNEHRFNPQYLGRLEHKVIVPRLTREPGTLTSSIRTSLIWPVPHDREIEIIQQEYQDLHVVMTMQDQGTDIAQVTSESPHAIPSTDGLFTTDRNVVLAAKSADCPLILASDGVVQGIAHSGWRGTLAGIGPKLIQTMIDAGAEPSRLRIHVGPGIRVCHYRVDSIQDPHRRAERFLEEFGSEAVRETKDGHFLSLPDAIHLSFLKAGIQTGGMTMDRRCTACKKNEYGFPSHRKEGAQRTGSIIATVYRRRFEETAVVPPAQPTTTNSLQPLEPLEQLE